MERQRRAQARHVAMLSSDAPVMNRCAKEEAHLKQRLAQSTAAITRSTQQNQAAADREQRAREAHIQSQLAAVLSKTPEIVVPSLPTPSIDNDDAAAVSAAAADKSRRRVSPAAAGAAAAPSSSFLRSAAHSAVAAPSLEEPSTATSSSPCLLGFPEPFENSGFKSAVHWASVAFDETFLTAYGPRRLREEAQASTTADAGGLPHAREAKPHRLMAAVACYLLNEVLCADATVAELWQEKLRQPIFDAIFSSHTITAGQERRKLLQGNGKASNEAVQSQVIIDRALGAAPRNTDEDDEADAGSAGGHRLAFASDSAAPAGATARKPADAAASASASPELPFPPRTNVYASRDDFATMRLWTEEVTTEQREKALVCRRARTLQQIMERRMHLLQVYQKQTNDAAQRTIFTAWRTHTRQCRERRAAMERYLENRHSRVLEENVFLRWRRVTLQAKVEALQRRMLNIVADREEASRQHAAALAAAQEQLNGERRQHQQAVFEQEALHTQVLESHSMEVEALRLVLHHQRTQTAEAGRWAKRWERLAKTFRPAQLYPPVPPAMWNFTRALYGAEETMVAKVLGKGGDRRILQHMPYSMILPVRERMEQLLLAWVNTVMERSPLSSSWVQVETFMHGRTSHPRSILMAQKASAELSNRKVSTASSTGTDSYLSEFGVYTLMAFIRELRRIYIVSGKMQDLEATDTRLPRAGTAGATAGGRTSLAKCFREVVQLLAVQTCAGLHPSLLTHCPSLSRWFTPEGIFGGPIKSFEGGAKERRLQHTMFIWLLTALLVGHIRMTLLAPAGEKDDGFPAPPPTSVGLQCSREAEMDRIAQINFPVDTPTATAAAAQPTNADNTLVPAQGTFVVASNTVLSKKAAKPGGKATSKGSPPTTPDAAGQDGYRSNDDSVFVMKGSVTLEAALQERLLNAKATATDAEDSLSDIEAYLGLLSAQSAVLRQAEGGAGVSPSKAATTGGHSSRASSKAAADKDQTEDLVNGLLQQLVEARDVAAQHRRAQRLQLESERGSDKSPSTATQAAEEERKRRQRARTSAATWVEYDSEDDDEEEGDAEFGDKADTTAAADDEAPNAASSLAAARGSATLTAGQLRVLRSLPSRSVAFDTVRAIPSASTSEAAAAATPPSALGDVASPGEPSGKFYSFLLNTLEDVTRRQQWAGMARVITSLVVRFHVLDDVEEGMQRANVAAATTREESQRDDFASRPASSRRPPSSPPAATAQPSMSSRLPAVLSIASFDGAAPSTARKPGAADKLRGAVAETARERGRGERVPATLVPSLPQAGSASDGRGGREGGMSALRVGVASLGEDFVGVSAASSTTFNSTAMTSSHNNNNESFSINSNRDSAWQSSPTGVSATVPPPHAKNKKKKAGPLMGAHEMRSLAAELRTRGQVKSNAGSQRSSVSVRSSAAASSKGGATEDTPLSVGSSPSASPPLQPINPQPLRVQPPTPAATTSSDESAAESAPRSGAREGNGARRQQHIVEVRSAEPVMHGEAAQREERPLDLAPHHGSTPSSVTSSLRQIDTYAFHETVQDVAIVLAPSASDFHDTTQLPASQHTSSTTDAAVAPLEEEAASSPSPTSPTKRRVSTQWTQTEAEKHDLLSPLSAASTNTHRERTPPPPNISTSAPSQPRSPLQHSGAGHPQQYSQQPAQPSGVVQPSAGGTHPADPAPANFGAPMDGIANDDLAVCPQDQLGYLDPLVEHGPPQSSAARDNIRKYRFNYQH